MIKKYEGIIVFLKKIKDNDLYIRILNNKDKLISGIVYGGNSSKKKQIFLLGFLFCPHCNKNLFFFFSPSPR